MTAVPVSASTGKGRWETALSVPGVTGGNTTAGSRSQASEAGAPCPGVQTGACAHGQCGGVWHQGRESDWCLTSQSPSLLHREGDDYNDCGGVWSEDQMR